MENLKLKYYFEHMDEFMAKEVFEGCKYAWEPLHNIKPYINQKIVEPDLHENQATMGQFVALSGNYLIGEGTKIGDFVSIQGPVYIGKNVQIASHAEIRPYSIIGDNAVIGHCCETKHCIIQNGAKVQTFTFCGDSIIGKSTRIGSGTILSNRRFDQKNITIKYKGERIDTGVDFFGAIVGDNTRMGANSTSVPGTLIGPYTWIMPTCQARGIIPREIRMFPKAEYLITENEKLDLKP